MYRILIVILLFTLSTHTAWAQSEVELEPVEIYETPADEDASDEYEYDEDVYDDEENEYDEYSDSEYDDYNEKEEVEELELRHADELEWAKLKKDKRFQYKKKKKKKIELDPPKPWFEGIGKFFSSTLFKFFLYFFLGAFLLFVIYLFIKNNNISFRRNIKDEEIVQEEPWEDVTSFEDWELALQKALAAGDYRVATRIYYLHTLHILDKNGLIQYREDKTNWFYVQKMFGTAQHDDFKELTRSFDYIWYGEYQISQEQFEVLASQFKNFKIQIS